MVFSNILMYEVVRQEISERKKITAVKNSKVSYSHEKTTGQKLKTVQIFILFSRFSMDALLPVRKEKLYVAFWYVSGNGSLL